jgi:hypothetical protein
MNGKPIEVASVTDFAQPGRRLIYGRHISVETALRAIRKTLVASWQASPGAQWWVIEIGADEDRSEVGGWKWPTRTLIAGPFDTEHLPPRV